MKLLELRSVTCPYCPSCVELSTFESGEPICTKVAVPAFVSTLSWPEKTKDESF